MLGDKIKKALGLLTSVIKCGEEWTDTCLTSKNVALNELKQMQNTIQKLEEEIEIFEQDYYYECIEEFTLPEFDEDDDTGKDNYLTIYKGSEWELSSSAPNDADICLQEIDGSSWLGIHQDILDEYFKREQYVNRELRERDHQQCCKIFDLESQLEENQKYIEIGKACVLALEKTNEIQMIDFELYTENKFGITKPLLQWYREQKEK